MNLIGRNLWALGLILLTVLVDQMTKLAVLAEPRFQAMECLQPYVPCGRISVAGPLDMTMLWNRGMSYGMFQSEGYMRWVLAAVMLAIACGFLYWLLVSEGRFLRVALSLVVGGAFGNLIDRVRFGAVVDFIDASSLHFPWIFNVADAAISVGAVLLFVDQFLLSGRKQAKT